MVVVDTVGEGGYGKVMVVVVDTVGAGGYGRVMMYKVGDGEYGS
jgi:hypothetical protein